MQCNEENNRHKIKDDLVIILSVQTQLTLRSFISRERTKEDTFETSYEAFSQEEAFSFIETSSKNKKNKKLYQGRDTNINDGRTTKFRQSIKSVASNKINKSPTISVLDQALEGIIYLHILSHITTKEKKIILSTIMILNKCTQYDHSSSNER